MLVLVILAGLLISERRLGLGQSPTLSVRFDNPSDQNQCLAGISSYFKTKDIAIAVTDATAADLVIAPQKLAHSTVIAETTSGQPASLNPSSGNLVSFASQPSLYLSTDRNQLGGQAADDVLGALGQQLLASQSTNAWTLNAVGDIIEGRYVYRTMRLAGDFSLPFSKTYQQLKSADVTMANLECTIADGIPYPEAGFTFNAPAVAMNGLTEAGIDAVNLANNHSYSEPVGFGRMLNNLNAANIAHFGGGQNSNQAHTPVIISTHGLKIALLGYDAIPGPPEATATTGGVAAIDIAPWYKWDPTRIATMAADIKKAKSEADLVFVYYHWGTEYTHDANDQQRQVAHAAIDAGADLILGTHPHWVQGIEWYHGKLITYSLGNFIFDQEWSVPTTQGTMLSATFDGTKLVGAKLTPYQITNYSTPGWLAPTSTMAKTILSDVYNHSWWSN